MGMVCLFKFYCFTFYVFWRRAWFHCFICCEIFSISILCFLFLMISGNFKTDSSFFSWCHSDSSLLFGLYLLSETYYSVFSIRDLCFNVLLYVRFFNSNKPTCMLGEGRLVLKLRGLRTILGELRRVKFIADNFLNLSCFKDSLLSVCYNMVCG